ncbi:ArsR family transcriptional regulator [Streptomyces chiangmaiensis]|uniref:ArsR family transcriptional regulator n=1 Tax=Streptomyces chiangmaiensis TaxID=766497 RepID=A0ABU7FRW1_9ACTN|nr:ArsR family transcriptional regulator [Streptomyces chiangmaiensis]MED7826492.1 ArsR family transcriptional regulator [Streptomyces chiangmaiensis]
MLSLLEEPLPTVELARRLRVTPSAVTQHLHVLHSTGPEPVTDGMCCTGEARSATDS